MQLLILFSRKRIVYKHLYHDKMGLCPLSIELVRICPFPSESALSLFRHHPILFSATYFSTVGRSFLFHATGSAINSSSSSAMRRVCSLERHAARMNIKRGRSSA